MVHLCTSVESEERAKKKERRAVKKVKKVKVYNRLKEILARGVLNNRQTRELPGAANFRGRKIYL